MAWGMAPCKPRSWEAIGGRTGRRRTATPPMPFLAQILILDIRYIFPIHTQHHDSQSSQIVVTCYATLNVPTH